MPKRVLSGRRILVVEDEYFLADEIERALKNVGVEVLGPVPSVRAALELIAVAPAPEVAVLDVNLDGELVSPVADALAARGVPFVFVSGYDEAALGKQHANALWLEKPVDAASLLRELRRLLSAT